MFLKDRTGERWGTSASFQRVSFNSSLKGGGGGRVAETAGVPHIPEKGMAVGHQLSMGSLYEGHLRDSLEQWFQRARRLGLAVVIGFIVIRTI